jgi:uncharacterized protein (DUF58 family)
MKLLFFTLRFYVSISCLIVFFVLSHFFPVLTIFSIALLILFFLLVFGEIFVLFLHPASSILAERFIPEKLSNGDDNVVRISILSNYIYPIKVQIIDELPFQFQKRDFAPIISIHPKQSVDYQYSLKPLKRGEYHFGILNIYALGFLQLAKRRFKFGEPVLVPVYPSFIQMRKFELLAISNRLIEAGIKKIRKVSRNNEFDQIKEYVSGDDYRTINWKATARKSRLMVNQYQDEKSQNLFCLIDMGRNMKSPFHGMTLLDYAINASLVISNIAMLKHDKAGLLTFNDKMKALLTADRGAKQLHKIMELLYNAETDFQETNYEMLYAHVKRNIKQRSLLLLFTNIQSMVSVQRHLTFLRELAKQHLLVVAFFENTELNPLLDAPSKSVEQVYIKTIAEKFVFEKMLIVKELNRNGIHTILTKPEDLTVQTINKYLELKALGNL